MDTATAPVATIGHNNPPPLREILAERFAPLSREIEQLAGVKIFESTKANFR